jgi:hypothetical protein
MDNIESGFGAAVHEASHRLSNKITRNESYDEFSRVSNRNRLKDCSSSGLVNQHLSIDLCIYLVYMAS